MAQGDYIPLANGSQDMLAIVSTLNNARNMLNLTVARMGNMTYQQINTTYGTNLTDEAGRTQIVSQFTAARDALNIQAVSNIIEFLGP